MGNGSSLDSSKVIYVEINGKEEKIVFSRNCSTLDIVDFLRKQQELCRMSLKDKAGAHVTISPTMPTNTAANPYKLVAKEVKRVDPRQEILQNVLTQVAEQFNRAFKVEETRTELTNRLNVLERRLEVDNLKAIEIEKCKKDISELKTQLYNNTKKLVDYNSLSALSDDGKISLKRDVPSYPKYTLSQETVDYLKQPTFDMWHWEPNEMLSLLEHMYHELGLIQEFNINPITLKRWLLCVQENYRNNPFHNFRHCFCVTQMMYGMIHLCDLWGKLPKEDLGIMLTACVCHDLDHPGYNNTYQINARTELAVRYNDISPLENHHCAVAFQILSNPETNIFANVDSTTFKRIRSVTTDMTHHAKIMEDFTEYFTKFDPKNKAHAMIMLILATDMARHSEILEAFKSKIDNFDFSNEDHVNSMKMVLVKCCDISNEVRPMEVSEPWVDCLLEEYFNQSDREKQEGLPVAPFMDRDKVTKPTAQIGFIKFVLIPMFDTVAKLFPPLENVMVRPLKDARDRYEEMKETQNNISVGSYFIGCCSHLGIKVGALGLNGG
ncbi:hypothetical protein CAPTEDRAFT_136586 [Capitella teleta]|uniref:Phosphodiesterase n=1 Tax=Capitella teleta TaxID=283909 RepID=R7UR98_CAPTE|nr:hypothetical protein CAPTEDRAFT_136586 [Capitella teleta]|eukprot:ELU08710.1 hypothetical protein CAPTEDRAFT_136586 [Capitella teleta]